MNKFKVLLCGLLFTFSAMAATKYGPYEIQVTNVHDGDTVSANILIWPQIVIDTNIRLKGIDTPEISSKSRCEKDLAIKARDFLDQTIKSSKKCILIDPNTTETKYAGRFGGDIICDGVDISNLLIKNGYAKPYNGRKKEQWCDEL